MTGFKSQEPPETGADFFNTHAWSQQLTVGPAGSLETGRLSVLMSWPDAVGLANHGLTVALQVADTGHSVRQGTTGPRQGNKSHLLLIQTVCFESSFSLY